MDVEGNNMTARDLLQQAIDWYDNAEEVESSPLPAWYKEATKLLQAEEDPHHGFGRSGIRDTES